MKNNSSFENTLPQPKFFGRRKGRVIRVAKTALLERFLPQIAIDEHTVFDPKTLFGVPVEKVYMEIGFGDGAHLAEQALKNKNIGFIKHKTFFNSCGIFTRISTNMRDPYFHSFTFKNRV